MPHNWKGEYIESKADRKTDRLGIGEIGGVGQLIYHAIRFSEYEWLDTTDARCPVRPVINQKSPLDMHPKGNMTGRDLLVSLCELARRIDDFQEPTPYYDLILSWCKEHMHPYQIDTLYREINDFDGVIPTYDTVGDSTTDTGDEIDTADTVNSTDDGIMAFHAKMLAADAAFTIDQFMKDLEPLYNAARYYIALDALCLPDNEVAYNMYQEGRHFEALPFFEGYKHSTVNLDIDIRSAGGDVVREMEPYNDYLAEHPELQQENGDFASEPYDDYEKLLDQLIDYIPDFRLRLRVDPKTNRIVFSADVKSVFDIAWYTLARMLSEEPPLEEKGRPDTRPEGIMICCHHCGRFFTRKSRQQQYCDLPMCQRARNAKNQQAHRDRRTAERVKAEIQNKKQRK